MERFDFVNYTLQWTRGEILEGKLIAAGGLLLIIIAILCWIYGNTPNAKALIIPLLVVGGLLAAMGISMVVSNQKRLVEFPKQYEEHQESFAEMEKNRVEDFQYLYTISDILVTVFLILGILFLWFIKNHHVHAIGIALIILGLSAFLIDYFSRERANEYYDQIIMHVDEMEVSD